MRVNWSIRKPDVIPTIMIMIMIMLRKTMSHPTVLISFLYSFAVVLYFPQPFSTDSQQESGTDIFVAFVFWVKWICQFSAYFQARYPSVVELLFLARPATPQHSNFDWSWSHTWSILVSFPYLSSVSLRTWYVEEPTVALKC